MKSTAKSSTILLSVLLAFCASAAFAQNETLSIDDVNGNATVNATINATANATNETENLNASLDQGNLSANRSLLENLTNPFAGARGREPKGSSGAGTGDDV